MAEQEDCMSVRYGSKKDNGPSLLMKKKKDTIPVKNSTIERRIPHPSLYTPPLDGPPFTKSLFALEDFIQHHQPCIHSFARTYVKLGTLQLTCSLHFPWLGLA